MTAAQRRRRGRSQGPVCTMSQQLQASLWLREVQRSYLECIDGVVWARAHGLYHLDPDTGSPLGFAGHVPDGFADEYEREGRSGDAVLHAAIDRGEAIDDTRIPDAGSWEQTSVYPVLARQGFGHSMEAPLYVDDELIGTINLARRPEDPPFSAAELALVERVASHVELALGRALRHEVTEQRATAFESTLDAIPQALVVSRLGDGRLLFVNQAARQLGSRRANGGAVTPEELVACDVRALSDGVDQVVHSLGPEPRHRATHLIATKSVRLTGCDEIALSFLSPRDSDAQVPLEHTPLSPREQELVELVSRGLSTSEIADVAYISINTVKQHLKRIFYKLGVHTRAELVHELWRGGHNEQHGRPVER